MLLKRPYLLCALFFCALSCGQQSAGTDEQNLSTEQIESLQKAQLTLQIFQNVFDKAAVDPRDDGREVPVEEARKCTGIYEPQMVKHGIDSIAGPPRNLGTVQPRKITTHEIFGGKNFSTWVAKTVLLLDSAGKGEHMEFQLHMGIYTDDFLSREFPEDTPDDRTMREEKKERMTIFVIPEARKIDSAAFARGEKQFTFDSAKLDLATAYELGGVRPK